MSSSVAVLWVAAASPNSEPMNNCGLIRVLESSRLFSPCLNQKVIKSKRKHTPTTTWRSSSVLTKGRNGVISSSLVASPTGEITLSSEEKVYNVVLKQAALVNKQLRSSCPDIDVKKSEDNVLLPGSLSLLGEAYDRCGEVCAEYAKTFYLGTLLMTPERRKAIWAIYGELTGQY